VNIHLGLMYQSLINDLINDSSICTLVVLCKPINKIDGFAPLQHVYEDAICRLEKICLNLFMFFE